ncbi:hypothetical protein VT84_32755 [Gemmata sp. SH-PL17]|uniref:hypothetical protein n=1 Tax=Gemmata sp. SH-PL17 TaxID=1630693 RepID=UPI00078D9D7E|nr:hypothetical protein [Gemmata sp. SH-PL17]AMV29211.1 hypothetical protein VT84_32755 [Gemmata sp. SH-PL17]
MADKLTQQILDALGRCAAEPIGLPLFAGKTEPGLFPNASSAKPAAQKCLADDLVRIVGTDAKNKTPRDLYGLTEKGWEFLLAAVNPKQVLEDFVRVLEARQGEIGELLSTARRMADSLQGLKDAVARVLPSVTAAKIQEPNSPAPFPKKEGGAEPEPSAPSALDFSPSPFRGGVGEGLLPEATAVLEMPATLAPAVLAYLADRSGPTDCPLPELFRALALTDSLTIGAFHDCLRQLHADGAVSFTAWAGPLYALPEPQYALLIGHGIAYYASLRS